MSCEITMRETGVDIQGDSLDEILIEAYNRLQASGLPNVGTRGPNKEIIGVGLRIAHPRARLSRSANRGLAFSALGEFLWYLTKSDDVAFITAYISAYEDEIDETGAINGAYGPRIYTRHGLNQIEAVIKLLERKPNTRRAVIQIYAAKDLETDNEVPCTTSLQFFIRDGRLHLMASLRSNDAYLGLPHDVFCFTMLQEMIARRLNVDVGEYLQMVGSFHLYDKHEKRAANYIKEGHHSLAQMPEMPAGDPFSIIPEVLHVEEMIRTGQAAVEDAIATLPDYWADLMRLVQAHFTPDPSKLDAITVQLGNRSYGTYIDDLRDRRIAKLAREAEEKI